MPGVWVMMSEDGVLRFVLDSSVEVEVKRWIHPDDVTLGADFLNVEVENEHLLAEDSDGLLGQFVHKKMTMTKLQYRKHKMIASLRSRSGREMRHGSAYLKNRKDPFFNRTTPCLNLRLHGQRLLDHPSDFYKIRDVFYV
ncbi:uncharacterized protein [Littorina saxatilis]|uniref:Uncharacterized protein n=1 Tax=Littorina saxatilis TaxID=31220 RepID=A0AAN9GAN2_9CAEN